MLRLNYRAETMIRYAVHAQPDLEVGGFARVEKVDGGLLLTDVLIPPQEVSGAALDLGRDGVEWMMVQLAERGETLSDWPCWFHSHSTMDTFHSSQDVKTLEHFAEMVKGGWAIGLVTNTKGEYDCWLHSIQEPWPLTQTKIDVETEQRPIDQPLFDEVAGMMKDVTKTSLASMYGMSAVERWNKTQGMGGYVPKTHQSPLERAHQAFDRLIYCDEHEVWEGDCPKYHQLAKNSKCNHQPNCGGAGCFAKKDRQEMRRIWISTHTVPAISITSTDGVPDDDPDAPPCQPETLLFRFGGWAFWDSGYIESPDGSLRVYGDDDFPDDLTKIVSEMDDGNWIRFQNLLAQLADCALDDDDPAQWDWDRAKQAVITS